MTNRVNVIGGGLAGVEAAWQAAEAGAEVRLYEMRPVLQTPAHRTDKLAEIVCSNSLKSDEPGSAPYLLKEELRRGRSLVMEAAAATRVPAGAAHSMPVWLVTFLSTGSIAGPKGVVSTPRTGVVMPAGIATDWPPRVCVKHE